MDCVQIPSIEYGEFNRRILDKTGKTRMPINGTFDITSRCNLKCIHCYIQGTYSGNDLTYPEICHVLDQVAEEGCLLLTLTGGEPLARPDFMDIYRYAKRKGMFITLFTNGTLITREIADFLAEIPPFAVEITIYGMTEDTYEKVTGVPGSYRRCLRGIGFLRERKLNLKLKCMVLTTNYHEFNDMKRYAEEMGVPFRFDALVNGKLDGSLDPVKFRISPEKIVELDFIDEKRSRDWHEFYEEFSDVPPSDRVYNCGAGLNSFHISSTGRLDVCIASREPDYDLRLGTFHEGFYNDFPAVISRQRTRYSECQNCDLLGICVQCPAWGQLEHGDPEARVDFICQVTKLRAAALKEAHRVRAESKL